MKHTLYDLAVGLWFGATLATVIYVITILSVYARS